MYARGHLVLSVPVYVIMLRYLSYPETLLSDYLFVLIFATMVGSLFPDIDLWFSNNLNILRHRNAFTHSVLFPALLYGIIMYTNISHYVMLIPILQAFLIGVASHLIGDNIKTGNLVGISPKWEDIWYTVNGILTLVILYITGFFSVIPQLLLH